MAEHYRTRGIPYRKDLKETARRLRKMMTPAEKKLWFGFLRNCGIRFLRQKPILDFVSDFYCHSHKLIIELDGESHFTDAGIQNDKLRTAEIEKLNIRILRYTNKEIDGNFTGVCEDIMRRCGGKLND